ncbi:MAG: DUF2244 domain-containing protein [Burkholderiales bacterium]
MHVSLERVSSRIAEFASPQSLSCFFKMSTCSYGHTKSASSLPDAWRFGRESDPSVSEWSVVWLLKRNCSMAPKQLFAVFGALCVLSLTIASYFWWQGATVIMAFAWVELLAVGTALLVYSRHAADQENIALRKGRLTVAHTSGNTIETAEFAPEWVSVEPVTGDESLIEVSGQGRRIEVGRFVRPELRRQLANELRHAVRLARLRPQGSLPSAEL